MAEFSFPLTLSIIHCDENASEDDSEKHIAEVRTLVVPRIGEVVWLNYNEAQENGMVSAWKVVNVCYWLPKSNSAVPCHSVAVYVEPIIKEG